MKIFAARAGDFPDQGWIVERVDGELRLVKQYAPEKQRRSAKHRHGYGQNTMPVLGFDLHRTLTPDLGYPLLSEPFPGVKEGMDQFVAQGCCLHISSASLDFPDQDINDARSNIAQQWVRDNGLPIDYIGPNSEATVRLDDRAINVPENPDWPSLWATAEKMLKKIYELDKNGRYVQRQDLKPAGELIEDDDYPSDEDVPQDAPRGFTTPLIDVDLHRTLMPAWGTRRDAKPNPDGVRCVREWYNAGYTIQISCGGWNPSLVEKPQFAVDRAAWQRRYLRRWGIPYDRLVAKDDVDVWFDDRAINYNGRWADADAAVMAVVGPPSAWPSHQVGAIPTAPIKSLHLMERLELELAKARDTEGLVAQVAEIRSQLAGIGDFKALLGKEQSRPISIVVQPPVTNINEGAVKVETPVSVINQPAAGGLEIKYPDGRKTTVKRT